MTDVSPPRGRARGMTGGFVQQVVADARTRSYTTENRVGRENY